ncbi:uncharacterized protein TM35_000064530, partial [Trypanosoma theileri]
MPEHVVRRMGLLTVAFPFVCGSSFKLRPRDLLTRCGEVGGSVLQKFPPNDAEPELAPPAPPTLEPPRPACLPQGTPGHQNSKHLSGEIVPGWGRPWRESARRRVASPSLRCRTLRPNGAGRHRGEEETVTSQRPGRAKRKLVFGASCRGSVLRVRVGCFPSVPWCGASWRSRVWWLEAGLISVRFCQNVCYIFFFF